MSTLHELPDPEFGDQSAAELLRLSQENQRIAVALRERANDLHAACEGRAAWAITELAEFADRLIERSEAYRAAARERARVAGEIEYEPEAGEVPVP